MSEQPGIAAAAFAAYEAIRNGQWDHHLQALAGAIKVRQRVIAELREFDAATTREEPAHEPDHQV